MKKLVCVTVAALFSFHAYAQEGHNGIRFDMNQKQIEAKGFACNPPKEKKDDVVAICHHMDMTGVAFGMPTQEYEVQIGPAKKVDEIRAELVGMRDLSDLFALYRKVENFFPKKDEAGTHSGQGVYMRNAWRANNNAGAAIFVMQGVRPITKTTVSVMFYSPRAMAAVDKAQAERAKKPATDEGVEKSQ